MKGVQCYELLGGIALKIHTFSFHFNFYAVIVVMEMGVRKIPKQNWNTIMLI